MVIYILDIPLLQGDYNNLIFTNKHYTLKILYYNSFNVTQFSHIFWLRQQQNNKMKMCAHQYTMFSNLIYYYM